MSDGIQVNVNELIELRRYAHKAQYLPQKQGVGHGHHLSRIRGRGMDFTEVRNYQAGDEIRHMEWRVTARTGKPHIKVYEEERERPVVIVTDFNPSMYFGTRVAFKSVIAARLSALIGWTACLQGDRVGGVIFSADEHHEFMPKNRDKGILPWLSGLSKGTKAIAQGTKNSPRPLSDVFLRLNRVCRPGSLLVVVSDFYQLDEGSEKHLSRLAAHNDILFYGIHDVVELSAPKPALYAITNGNAHAFLDTREANVRHAFDAYCQDRLRALNTFCARLCIPYTPIHSELDLPTEVRRTFPRSFHA